MPSSANSRTSIEGLFRDLKVSETSRSRSASSKKRKNTLSSSLKGSIRGAGFPSWKTLRGLSSSTAEECKFILHMNDNYHYYKPEQEKHNVVFERSSAIIQELKTIFDTAKEDNDLLSAYTEFTADTMAHMVYGSNMQEKAGMGLDETINLCRRVFAGENIDPNGIEERSSEYEAQLKLLVEHGVESPGYEHVIRSRREVIQHAQALKYITDAALLSDNPLTEQLIKDTHQILCNGVALDDGTNSDEYAGQYRTIEVRAGNTVFTHPSRVPREMGIFINDFNNDIRNREKTKDLDPFYLAADLCQDFVTIHPFRDGNGRMCRLLANAFLMKYAGIVISIGEHDEDRTEYLKIAEMAGDGETEEEARGTLAGFFLEKADQTLRDLKARLRLRDGTR
ncbi:hypothetical protein VTL71DRAFT_3119 [Oculimacula yallundae]|uniref:Fido domain-containing protein n=1 Tax=Oculimacula yallundae TaxID=86028 RepID=A0ABR4C856_9HELO